MNKYLVEFLGTLFLMFVIFATDNWIAIGCALALAFKFGSKISGGAFNPAITLAFYSAGKISKNDIIIYIIAQILGAFSALYLYKTYVNN